ncbi:MAG TPA: LemA family protein [Planctomycetia bacterium]|nr:LemA family protein [Planctomycetia bacterium]
MGGATIGIIIVGGLVALFALFFIAVYNSLVVARNRYKNAFSQIDVQLKRRYDLIPNLVEVAKGYMKHERETLEAVIAMRNQAYAANQKAAANPGDPSAMHALAASETALAGAMTKFMAVAEAYPDLKANQNMMSLQEELTSTENKVAFARQSFNDSVTAYNNAREVFPAVLIAGIAGFQPAELLQVESPAERAAPKVSFS